MLTHTRFRPPYPDIQVESCLIRTYMDEVGDDVYSVLLHCSDVDAAVRVDFLYNDEATR